MSQGLPKGYPEHRYIYSTEGGDSCSCGWEPPHFRIKDQAEWDAHVGALVPPEDVHPTDIEPDAFRPGLVDEDVVDGGESAPATDLLAIVNAIVRRELAEQRARYIADIMAETPIMRWLGLSERTSGRLPLPPGQ